MMNTTIHGCLEIWDFLTHSLCSLMNYQVEFYISARPSVVLYLPSYLLFSLLESVRLKEGS